MSATTRANLVARAAQLAFVALVGATWFWASATGSVSRLFLPQPAAVWTAFGRLIETGAFWSAVGVTLSTVGEAYAIAVLCGVLVGTLISRSRLAVDVLEPVLSSVFTIPLTLFFPMFILFFGVGTGSKVAYGAIYGFFPIVLNTIAAFARIDERYVKAARSMGASGWQLFRYVLMPGAFPVLVNGLRIGFFITFASVLGGETLSSVAGIGRNIALAAELMEPARMFAWILFVIAISISLNLLLSHLEDRGGGKEPR